jgi:murein DD-endopeptidase MepM/ murein hydrolase activator NlpD
MRRLITCLFFAAYITLFSSDSTIDVSLSSTDIYLGEPIEIVIETEHKIKKAHIGMDQKNFDVFLKKQHKQKYTYISYVAASRKLNKGKLPLNIHVLLDSDERFFKSYIVTLDYPPLKPSGSVRLSKAKGKLNKNTKILSNEGALISDKFNLRTNNMYVKARFIQPAIGRISSVFGAVREYNGTYSRSHAGVDIANKTGTRIIAPNYGKVVMSKKLEIHGNTIMIDHGFGIVTIYNHLNKRYVALGDLVKTGQSIGTIGETGIATGPHLHWGMSVQGVRVDPFLFIDVFNNFKNTKIALN